MSTPPSNVTGNVVWAGRPSIGVYVILYGVLALVVAVLLVGLEVWVGDVLGVARGLLFGSTRIGSFAITDLIELVTVVVIFIALLVKVLGLVIYRAGHSYELHTDGLYVNRGIANLQNTFISAMAFSDARLIRSLGMRIVGRSVIIVEANDGRRFELRMLKDGVNVQALIRSNLSHPTVRMER